jgi:hypothetical protein
MPDATSIELHGSTTSDLISIVKKSFDLWAVNIDKGHPEIYRLLNAVNVLNGYNIEYKKYIDQMQTKFDQNYESCLIKSNFLFAIANTYDRNESIEEVKKKINKSGKVSFDELTHSSSEFIMSIFNGDKIKFKWFFNIITKMEYYKKLKISADCFVCGTTKHLNYCSCQDIAYCSIKCQRYDWETHKLTCKFYFKENCKKEFNYIVGQPMNTLVLSKKEHSKLDQDQKKILKELNNSILAYITDKSKEINLLDDKYAFDLMVKCRIFLYITKHKDEKCDGVLHIYKNTERVIKELKKIHILGQSYIENFM